MADETLRHKLDRLTVANDVLTGDILRVTGSTLDTDGLQMEAMLTSMRDLGVLTEYQEIKIKLDWAVQHNAMLTRTIEEIKKQQARQALTRGGPKAAGGLILPNGQQSRG